MSTLAGCRGYDSVTALAKPYREKHVIGANRANQRGGARVVVRPEPAPRPTEPRPQPAKANAPGASGLAGAVLLRDALARLDDKTRAAVLKNLTDVLPHTLAAGKVGADRAVHPGDLRALIPAAAISAAGLDPARTGEPAPPVLWERGGNRLLVLIAGVRASLGDGLLELTVPVSCDQTGDTGVTVTFATGSTKLPTGGVTVAEDHPRGPAVIVENWHEPLLAFAWQTVLFATAALAGAAGTDTAGRSLITNAITVDADGLTVTPMAPHTFSQAG
jgi:hypothetical protein